MHIRFRQVDVLWEDVHGEEAGSIGVPLSEPQGDGALNGGRWLPFQVEFRSVPREDRGEAISMIRLAIWERFEEGL